MSETTVVVVGMSCDACVRSVTQGLGRLPGVQRVEVDLPTGKVKLTHDAAFPGIEVVKKAVDDIGYEFGGVA